MSKLKKKENEIEILLLHKFYWMQNKLSAEDITKYFRVSVS